MDPIFFFDECFSDTAKPELKQSKKAINSRDARLRKKQLICNLYEQITELKNQVTDLENAFAQSNILKDLEPHISAREQCVYSVSLMNSFFTYIVSTLFLGIFNDDNVVSHVFAFVRDTLVCDDSMVESILDIASRNREHTDTIFDEDMIELLSILSDDQFNRIVYWFENTVHPKTTQVKIKINY